MSSSSSSTRTFTGSSDAAHFYPDLNQLSSGMSNTFVNVVRDTKRTSVVHSVVGFLLNILSHLVLYSLRLTQWLLNSFIGRSRRATDAADANTSMHNGSNSWLLAYTPLGLIVKINTWIAVVSLKLISLLLAHFPAHHQQHYYAGDDDTHAGASSSSSSLSKSDSSHPISAHTKLSPTDAEELMFIEKGVQIFYLQPDGSVHSPATSTSLRILQLDVPEEMRNDKTLVTSVLQVGDWNYPLFPGASPSLSADYGAYIFPNLGEESQDACVGIIFDRTVPKEAHEAFDRIIKQLTSSKEVAVTELASVQQAAARSEERQESRSKALSEHLIKQGTFISSKINELSEQTQQVLRARSERIQDSITLTNRSSFRVHWTLLKSLEGAGWMAGKARQGSAKMVAAVGYLTVALAKRLCSTIITTGSLFVPASVKNRDPNAPPGSLDKLADIAGAGVVSASTVYVSLENAAITLAKSLANESVNVIDVKYGEDAAHAARHSAVFLGNSAMTGYNISNIAIGPKAIARRVVKDTGKTFVKGWVKPTNPPEADDPGDSHTRSSGGGQRRSRENSSSPQRNSSSKRAEGDAAAAAERKHQ